MEVGRESARPAVEGGSFLAPGRLLFLAWRSGWGAGVVQRRGSWLPKGKDSGVEHSPSQSEKSQQPHNGSSNPEGLCDPKKEGGV